MRTKVIETEGAKTPEEQHDTDLEKVEEVLSEPEGPTFVEPVVLHVRRQYKEEGDLVIDPEEMTEEIAIQDFAVEPARTGLQINHTMNMTNFWSTSVQVSLTVPCYREEAPAAFEYASKFVAERLSSEIEAARDRTEELRQRGPSSSGGGGGGGGGYGGSDHPF